MVPPNVRRSGSGNFPQSGCCSGEGTDLELTRLLADPTSFQALEELTGFEYVIIDCQPTLGVALLERCVRIASWREARRTFSAPGSAHGNDPLAVRER